MATSLTELFGREVSGEALTDHLGRSGARLERVAVDGQHYVLKYRHPGDTWAMRATGDVEHRPVAMWRDRWLDRLPPAIDHAVVGAAWDDRGDGRGTVLVMRDVSEHLVPEDDSELPLDQHRAFLDRMAELHATFWGCRGSPGLLPLSTRLIIFGPQLGETERALGSTDLVPTQLVPEGWTRLGERAPRTAEILSGLHDDPTPLVDALAATPQTLVHGDWRAGNLGSHPDGRTILIDWDLPGIAPGCLDVAWYVCLNRARLPETKEAALQAYRESLERHGVDTGPWWQQQLALSLLGIMVLFGWEKALGDDEDATAELAWWQARVLEGAAEL